MTPRPDYNGPGSSFEDGTYEARDDLEREAAADLLACRVNGYGDKWIARWQAERAARLAAEAERCLQQVKRGKLLEAILLVHSQHADDLCWLPADVNPIFAAAGLPLQDLHVGDKNAMLQNCERYIDCLQSGGPWVSYAELEAQRDEARRVAMELLRECRGSTIWKHRAAHPWLTEADNA